MASYVIVMVSDAGMASVTSMALYNIFASHIRIASNAIMVSFTRMSDHKQHGARAVLPESYQSPRPACSNDSFKPLRLRSLPLAAQYGL